MRTGPFVAQKNRRAFLLLETILAVVLVVVAVVGIAKAFDELLDIQSMRVEQGGIRQALTEVVTHLQTSPAAPPEQSRMRFSEWWNDVQSDTAMPLPPRVMEMELEILAEPVQWENSEGTPLSGLYQVTVTITDPATKNTDRVLFVLSR